MITKDLLEDMEGRIILERDMAAEGTDSEYRLGFADGMSWAMTRLTEETCQNCGLAANQCDGEHD